jgi:hypothetical protein
VCCIAPVRIYKVAGVHTLFLIPADSCHTLEYSVDGTVAIAYSYANSASSAGNLG